MQIVSAVLGFLLVIGALQTPALAEATADKPGSPPAASDPDRALETSRRAAARAQMAKRERAPQHGHHYGKDRAVPQDELQELADSQQRVVPDRATGPARQFLAAPPSRSECEDSWGSGPPYEDNGYPAWLWLALDRQHACSLAGVGGHEPSAWSSGALPFKMVSYEAFNTVETITSSNELQLTLSLGEIVENPYATSPDLDRNTDTLTIDIDCLDTADEVVCETSDGESGETRTVAAWENSTITVTADLNDSTGFLSDPDRKFQNALYIRTDLHSGPDEAGFTSFMAHELLHFRCDYATYIPNTSGKGCVFHTVVPQLVFDGTPAATYPEAPLHIRDALYAPERTYPGLAQPIPGRLDRNEPLTRNYHGNLSRTRVRSLCNTRWPGYADEEKQCDEYPFRTTYQNANYSDAISVRPINGSDNGSAGNRLVQFYNTHRLLDGDAFYVDVAAHLPNPGDISLMPSTEDHGYCEFSTIGGWTIVDYQAANYCFETPAGNASVDGWDSASTVSMDADLRFVKAPGDEDILDSESCSGAECEVSLGPVTGMHVASYQVTSSSLEYPMICLDAEVAATYPAGTETRSLTSCIQAAGGLARRTAN